jgi:hypothetical protein
VLCTCADRFLGDVTVNKVGTIISDARPKMNALLVEFDEDIGGHDGGRLDDEGKSLGKAGHCNWVKPDCLLPLT